MPVHPAQTPKYLLAGLFEAARLIAREVGPEVGARIVPRTTARADCSCVRAKHRSQELPARGLKDMGAQTLALVVGDNRDLAG